VTQRLRIIVLGYVIRGPLGGIAWHYLQYVSGLAQLGHDVYFFEDSGNGDLRCYDPSRDVSDASPAYGLKFAQCAFDRLGLGERWAYCDTDRGWLGPAAAQAHRLARSADVVLNVSGVNPIRRFEEVPVRVLVDTDPAFTQVRHLTDAAARARAAAHTSFFSFGANIGEAGCAIPDDGFRWRATRQPIVMDAWGCAQGDSTAALSTVMLWDSYRGVEHNGTHYGMKSDSFGPYEDLPSRCGERFEVAVGCRGGVREHLTSRGWIVIDPRQPTRDPWTYQDFIKQSKAEFSVAKHGYVVTDSGWFSERSAAYLASGRPVIVQETGFSRWLNASAGVLAFSTADEAVARVQELNGSYERHCRTAREIAGDCFGSAHVLTGLLDAALN
jgi:hypothetical protein